MSSLDRPGAIDTRLVFRVYAAVVGGAGVLVYMWWPVILPDAWAQSLLTEPDLAGVPWGRFALVRIAATVVAAFGMCALAFAAIEDPWSRGRALFHFAMIHLVAGVMFWLQWMAIVSQVMPERPGLSPLAIGVILLYFAVTQQNPDLRRPMRRIITLLDGPPAEAPVDRLRSQYQEQIARVARQEERARLARDLHDAVKQQLFVIQTAAATAQTRFDEDAAGAKTALDQIRVSAREATTEMEAMIEQLHSPPLANAGLIEALGKQSDALRFRTGAAVTLTADPLPPEWALPPGTPEALFRIAQEALANVARHARARLVGVRLDAVAERLTLTIHDDGRGFEPDTATRRIGTTGMRARAEEIGGTFELRSRPGGGTTVKVSVPYESVTPLELRNKALAWGGGAIVSLAVLALISSNSLELTHAWITAAMAATSVRHGMAYVRLRRRGGTVA